MKTIVVTLAGLLLSSMVVLADASSNSAARVVDLRVEGMSSPEAVNHPLPRFGWRIETKERGYLQTSYRILAASSAELLARDKGDLWDSGEKPGRKAQYVEFEGAPLRTGQVVHWKVRSKNRAGQFTPWSAPAAFTTKLSGPPELPSPLFLPLAKAPPRSSFESSDPKLNAIYALAARRLHEITSVRDIGFTMRAAAYHQEIHPRASAWLHHLNASLDAAGFYPATLPSDGTYGSTQSDGAVSAIHALWWMTGDSDVLTRSWPMLTGYVAARKKADFSGAGARFGSIPADSLGRDDPTPDRFLHQASQALNIRLMLEMSKEASRNPYEGRLLNETLTALVGEFRKAHLDKKGSLAYASLPAHLLALRSGLLNTADQKASASAALGDLLTHKELGGPFSQGALTPQFLLPVLTWTDRHEDAIALVRAQEPDQLTPAAAAAISEWLISMVVGINTLRPGFQDIHIRPHIAAPDTLQKAKAVLKTSFGDVSAGWAHESDSLMITVAIPSNTSGLIELPLMNNQTITESGQALANSGQFFAIQQADNKITFRALPGTYQFKISK